jgi:hypothetical protein
MFAQTFYHGTLKKYVILFGTLFNDIWVNRVESGGAVKQSMKVPISYGPREKLLARIVGDPDLDKEFAIVLPRMGFEMTSFSYAPERKLPTINKFVTAERSGEKKSYQYNPVPYDIGFQLSIFTKFTEDGTYIIEQILPYFTPEWNTTVQLISDPDITLDIPLVIQGVAQDDLYEGSYEDRRSVTWTIDFIMKGYLFGPTKKSGVIKLANTTFFDATLFDTITDAVGDANTETLARVAIYPGQDANGAATTNASIAIANTDSIDQDEDWDYVVTVTDPLLEE